MNKIIFIMLLSLFTQGQASGSELVVGAERYATYLPQLKDKSGALMVNQSSLVGKQHLVDVLLAKGVKIKSILAVEHGFRGDLGAGENVASKVDTETGINIISLYGKQRYLTPEQLEDIDVLIYDLQDVGVRFYTYSRSLHDLLQTCHRYYKRLIVLDRPNPNGDYIAGPILKPEFNSGLSITPIPLVHGVTMAELAQMIIGEGWLEGEGNCQLKVVPIANYDHNTKYTLPVRPSPNLPNDLSIRLYPTLAMFEGTSVSVGRGTDFPFQVLGYPDARMGDFKFITKPISGSWRELNHTGKQLYGEKVTTSQRFDLSIFSRWLQKFKALNKPLISRPDFFDKLLGDDSVRKSIEAGVPLDQIEASWQNDLQNYQSIRKQYLLYPESDWIKERF